MSLMPLAPLSVRRLAWITLGWTLGVVVFGAYVRASKSGDGCGAHWPACNGQFIPLEPSARTVIEFTHRVTSGVALLLSLGLFVWSLRRVARGSPVRLGVTLGLGFMILEALVGALLVKAGWVAANESVGRAVVMSVHLINTFLLVGAQVLTVFWAQGGGRLRVRDQGATSALLIGSLFGVVILGVSGAVTALGDTLFPAATLAEGLARYPSPFAQVLLPLRMLHPIISLFIGALLFAAAASAYSRGARRQVFILAGAFALQLCIGLLNVALLAPVWVQLLHLLVADLVWIALVYLAATALSQPHQQASPALSAATSASA